MAKPEPYVSSGRPRSHAPAQYSAKAPAVKRFAGHKPPTYAPKPTTGKKAKPQRFPEWWHELSRKDRMLYLQQHPASQLKMDWSRQRPDSKPDDRDHDNPLPRETHIPNPKGYHPELLRLLSDLKPEQREQVETAAQATVKQLSHHDPDKLLPLVDKRLSAADKAELDEVLQLRKRVDAGEEFEPETIDHNVKAKTIFPKQARRILTKFALITLAVSGGVILASLGMHTALAAATSLKIFEDEAHTDMVGAMWDKIREPNDDWNDEYSGGNSNYNRKRAEKRWLTWMQNAAQSDRVTDIELTDAVRHHKWQF